MSGGGGGQLKTIASDNDLKPWTRARDPPFGVAQALPRPIKMAAGGGGGLTRSVANDFKHACAIFIAMGLFLFVVFVDWDPILNGRSNQTPPTDGGYDETSSGKTSSAADVPPQLDWSNESPALQKLVEDIRAATRVASGGAPYELTTREIEDWHAQYPCQSRSHLLPMYDKRKHTRALSPDSRLERLLTEYSKLHRTCLQKVGSNMTDIFIHNRTLPGCTFLVGNPMFGTGLGNKIIVTISALLYAVLTQRVFLVPDRTNLPSLLCEPFVGSSWRLDSTPGMFPYPDGDHPVLPWIAELPDSLEWARDLDFLRDADSWLGAERLRMETNVTDSDSLRPPALKYAVSITVRWQPATRFYCNTEQRMLDAVPWLYWGGCIYSVPKMFAMPTFQPSLDALFPDRMVMTRVLRTALLPHDVVFSKFTAVNDELFQGTERRIGIQLRSRQGKQYYARMNVTISERISNCMVTNDLLPNATSVPGNTEANSSASSGTKIYIASLYRGLYDYLTDHYKGLRTSTGGDVEVIQVSSREDQQLGVEEDIQAFVEILLLSLSDHLLVTPASTFGSIAQAYGALIPWFIESREDSADWVLESCERAQSIDICHQHITSSNFNCTYDPSLGKKPIFANEPSLKRCMSIDHGAGVQLISNFQSDKLN